jgi:long-chain acyl-CoA synthetase
MNEPAVHTLNQQLLLHEKRSNAAYGSPDTLQALRDAFPAKGTLPAVISFVGDQAETWSFAQLREISARFAAGLQQRGIGFEEGVALIAPNSPRWLAAFWGIQAAGIVAVPMDGQNDDPELARMLEIGHCTWAVTTASLASRLRAIVPSCRLIILDTEEAAAPDESWRSILAETDAALRTVAPSDIAVIVFTSGTTGNPKAVPLTHANLLTNVRALAATRLVGAGDRSVLPLPLYHVYPLTIGLITPLALGCAVILPGGISGPELLAALRDGGATVLIGVPRLYGALLDAVRRGIATQPRITGRLSRATFCLAQWATRRGVWWPRRLLLAPLRHRIAPRLRMLVSGGAAVPFEVEEALTSMGWEVLTGYGLVETSSMLTFNPPGAARIGTAGAGDETANHQSDQRRNWRHRNARPVGLRRLPG